MKLSVLIKRLQEKAVEAEKKGLGDCEVAIFPDTGGPRLYFQGFPEGWDYYNVGDRFYNSNALSEKLRENASTVVEVGGPDDALLLHQRRQAEIRSGNCMDPACPEEPKPHKEHGGRIS